MKLFFSILFMVVVCTAGAQDANTGGRIRAGAGYVHDFPGLNGAGAYAEYSFPLNEYIEGGIGFRRVQTAGYPRSASVNEYTKASSLDFNLLFVPYHTENAAFRIGAGYSFSFYNIRRSYPVYAAHTDAAAGTVTWPVADSKGRSRGISLIAEYEYCFNNGFSAGAKLALCKAYGSVVMGGPFVAIRL